MALTADRIARILAPNLEEIKRAAKKAKKVPPDGELALEHIAADETLTTVEESKKRAVEASAMPLTGYTVEHWGIYEINRLTRLSADEFRAFVVACYGARKWTGADANIQGVKAQELLWGAGPKETDVITATDVKNFAQAVMKTRKPEERQAIMIGWGVDPKARAYAEQVMKMGEAKPIQFIKLRLWPLAGDDFKAHVTKKHDKYKEFFAFILPPDIPRIGVTRIGARHYRFDVSEARSMNTGGKIVNVQWDFDFRDSIFSATQGYQLCRKERKGKGESGFEGDTTVEYTFDLPSVASAKEGHVEPGIEVAIACRVQDDLGGEGMKAMTLKVEREECSRQDAKARRTDHMNGKEQHKVSNLTRVFVPYDAVFSDGPATFDVFKRVLKSLSRTDTLFWCSRLNLILADPQLGETAKQQQCLDIFFSSQQIQTMNRFVRQHDGSDHVMVVHRGALLELIRWACRLCNDHPDDGTTCNKAEVRDPLARALLIASELWGKRVYGDSAFEGASLDERRRNALGLIRHSIGEASCHPRPFEALARGSELFSDIMPRFFGSFADAFRQQTGLTLDEYYLGLCTIMAHYMNSDAKSGVGGKQDSGIFTLKGIRESAPHMEGLFGKFFNLLSATADDLKGALWHGVQAEPTDFQCEYNLKPVRGRPILRASDGRMIVLDPVCFAEKASVGPLFHVLTSTNQNALFSAFGSAFEAYVRDILLRVYPDSGTLLAKRFYPDVRDVGDSSIQVADFIIDDVTDMVMVEAKAVWIQDAKMSSSDPMGFVQHLQSRYGGKQTEKGYRQLARNVANIATGQWGSAGIDLTRTRFVLPVLLVHDGLLDAPGFGNVLAEEFRTHLHPDSGDSGGWMVKGGHRIAPLIIMTTDDLERLESSLSTFSLVELLKAYSAAHPDRMVSLHNYLAANSKRFPLIHNKNMASRCMTILEDCMRRVFPDKAAADFESGAGEKIDP